MERAIVVVNGEEVETMVRLTPESQKEIGDFYTNLAETNFKHLILWKCIKSALENEGVDDSDIEYFDRECVYDNWISEYIGSHTDLEFVQDIWSGAMEGEVGDALHIGTDLLPLERKYSVTVEITSRVEIYVTATSKEEAERGLTDRVYWEEAYPHICPDIVSVDVGYLEEVEPEEHILCDTYDAINDEWDY